MILNELKSLPEDSSFILSDADIFVSDSNKFFTICQSKLRDNTIVGMAEWTDNTEFTNIGILLCKNTKQVRSFFAFLEETIEATGSQDQALFNKHIGDWISDRSVFSTSDVIQSNMRNLYSTPFSVIQFLSSSSTSNMNIYEKLITAARFLDITPVLHLVPFEIQEALVLFCKDHMPSNPVCAFELKNE